MCDNELTIIHQGDQYYLPFSIMRGDTTVTPENTNDIRLQVNNHLYQYSEGTALYDSQEEQWMAFLTEDETREFSGGVMVQVGVKVNNTFKYSDSRFVDVSETIIKQKWGD